MGRKVLISFLGTGPTARKEPKRDGYNKATYKIGSKEYRDKEIITDPLFDHFEIDQILAIGTMKSLWEKFYEIFSKKLHGKQDEDLNLSLWDQGKNSNHKSPLESSALEQLENELPHIKTLLIKYGLDDNELKENFIKITSFVQNYIQQDDKLYIDITHAFRSIPVYAIFVILYLQNVSNKKVSVQGIYYGMYEAKYELGGISPVVNLSYMLELNKWNEAVRAFKEYGDIKGITDLIRDEDFQKKAEKFIVNVQTNDIKSLKTNAIRFKQAVEKLESSNTPLEFIKAPLLEFPTSLADQQLKEWEVLLSLSGRYFRLNQYQFTVFTLWEAIISKMANNDNESLGNDFDKNKEYARRAKKSRSKFYYDGRKEVSFLFGKSKYKYRIYPKSDNEFGVIVRRIELLRNIMAHIRNPEDDIDLSKIDEEVPYLFKYVHSNLKKLD